MKEVLKKVKSIFKNNNPDESRNSLLNLDFNKKSQDPNKPEVSEQQNLITPELYTNDSSTQEYNKNESESEDEYEYEKSVESEEIRNTITSLFQDGVEKELPEKNEEDEVVPVCTLEELQTSLVELQKEFEGLEEIFTKFNIQVIQEKNFTDMTHDELFIYFNYIEMLNNNAKTVNKYLIMFNNYVKIKTFVPNESAQALLLQNVQVAKFRLSLYRKKTKKFLTSTSILDLSVANFLKQLDVGEESVHYHFTKSVLRQLDRHNLERLIAVYVDECHKLSSKNFIDMTESELKDYFLRINFLNNASKMLKKHEYQSFIMMSLRDYNDKVETFKSMSGSTVRKFDVLYQHLVRIDQVLSQLSPSEENIYANFRNFIFNTKEAFLDNLQKNCEHYRDIKPTDYSKNLKNLFESLAQIPDWQKLRATLENNVINSIILYIQGEDLDYGWSSPERVQTIIDNLLNFIPKNLYEQYFDKIIQLTRQRAQAMSEINVKETENLNANNLSIADLVDRLVHLSKYYIATDATGNEVEGFLSDYHREYALNVKACLEKVIEEKSIQLFQLKNDNLLLHRLEAEAYAIFKEVQYYLICEREIAQFFRVNQNQFNEACRDVSSFLHNKLCILIPELNTTLKTQYKQLFESIPNFLSAFYLLMPFLNGDDTSHGIFFGVSEKIKTLFFEHLKAITLAYISLLNVFYEYLDKSNFVELRNLLNILPENKEILNDFLILIANIQNNAPNLYDSIVPKWSENYFRESNIRDHLQCLINAKYNGLSDNFDIFMSNQQSCESENAEDKKAFYKAVFETYEALKNYQKSNICQLLGQPKDIKQRLKKATEGIHQNVKSMTRIASETLSQGFPSLEWTNYRRFNMAYENLIIARQFSKDQEIVEIIKQEIEAFKKTVTAKLDNYLEAISNKSANIEAIDIIDCLIRLQILKMHVKAFEKQAFECIEKLLAKVLHGDFPKISFASLGEALHQYSGDGTQQTQLILREQPVFTSLTTALRNRKTASQNIDYVATELQNNSSNTDVNSDLLKGYYDYFTECYWDCINKAMTNNSLPTRETLNDIIRQDMSNYPTKIIQLAANLFAYWSIQHYRKNMAVLNANVGPNDQQTLQRGDSSIRQPHPVQVVAIFRLLGLDKSLTNINADAFSHEQYLQNHLAEVLTGEGKSIVLAVLAQILALLGYKVDCACYSSYLSERDYRDFSEMFQAFGLDQQIFYGTFKGLIEQKLDAQYGDLRRQVGVQHIGKLPVLASSKISSTHVVEPPSILLLDEVDVFLNKKIHEDTYSMSTIVPSQASMSLMRYIWNITKQKIKRDNSREPLAYVKQHCKTNYDAIINQSIQGFAPILDNMILAMIEDAEIYHNQQKEHFIFNKEVGKIGYKMGDHQVEYNVAYRYQKMFAYIDHFESGKITDSRCFLGEIGLLVECGAFSYIEMMKDYRHILGVTGTLSTLNEMEKSNVESVLKTRQFTYMPSAYGKNEMKAPMPACSVIFAESDEAYFSALVEEITRNQGETSGLYRPIFLFFETSEKLADFNQYLQEVVKLSGRDIVFLDESMSEAEIGRCIKRATALSAILLTTKAFGRGTDFIVYDNKVNEIGGPHVIQAFFSDDIAEEVQIQGRTGRQGGKGSFSIIVDRFYLELKYDLSDEQLDNITDSRECYERLDQMRQKKLAEQNQKIQIQVTSPKDIHESSIAFADSLVGKGENPSNQSQDVIKNLRQFNEFKSVKQPRQSTDTKCYKRRKTKEYKTVFLIDGTGSMGELLYALKEKIEAMFERTLGIVSEAEKQARFQSVMQIKILVYRNYNSPINEILEVSDWFEFNNMEDLKTFLARIRPKGGGGEFSPNEYEFEFKKPQYGEVLEKTLYLFFEEDRLKYTTKTPQGKIVKNDFTGINNYKDITSQIRSNCSLTLDQKAILLGRTLENGHTQLKDPVYWRSEAVEVALEYINKKLSDEDIKQIIWIGDMPPNSKEATDQKRQLGHPVHRLSDPVYFDHELEKIKSKNISMHTICIQSYPDSECPNQLNILNTYFNVAQKTKGECKLLDIKQDSAAEDLTHMVVKNILKYIGGTKKGDTYVKMYETQYCATHTTSSVSTMTTTYKDNQRVGFFGRSRPESEHKVSSSTLVPRNTIIREWQDYLDMTSGVKSVGHLGGRLRVNKLLEEASKLSDSELNARFFDWLQTGGETTKKFAERYMVYDTSSSSQSNQRK